MASPIQQVEGQAVVEFQITLPDQPALPLTSANVTYRESSMLEDVYGKKEYRHVFSIPYPEFVNDVLRTAMFSGTPAFRSRLGLGQPGKMQWLPWQEHYIVHYSAVIEGYGHRLEITTSDALFKMGRSNKTAARKGKISDMVAQIAEENSVDYVIEPTKGDFLYIQNFVDDTWFISNRLLNRAINAKGRGNFVFYVLDNVLHFHTPDFQTTVKTVEYYHQPTALLAQVDRSQQLWDEGISGTRLVLHNPLTGKSQEVANDPSSALRLAKGIYDLTSVTSGKRNVVYHQSANRQEEAEAYAQNIYEQARMNTFEVNVDIEKNIGIRTGDIINLVVNQRPEKTTAWSGYYFVTGVVYTIVGNAITMKLILRRGEIAPDPKNVVTQAANLQLVPQNEAPGQDLNVAEAKNSLLTSGQTAQQSGVTYLSLSDPQKSL